MFCCGWLGGKSLLTYLHVCVPITWTYIFKKKHLFIVRVTLLNQTKVVRKEGDGLTYFDFEGCYCTDCQKLNSLSTTVLYRTILTQVIMFHILMKWLLGSGDRWHGPEIWRQSSQKALTVDRKWRKNFDSDNPFLSSEATSVHFCILLAAK